MGLPPHPRGLSSQQVAGDPTERSRPRPRRRRSPATRNHPLGRRFPPGPGAVTVSELVHRRCQTASGPSTRSVSRTTRRSPTDHVLGLWESLWVRSICLFRGGSRGLTNRPRGPSACGIHLMDPGNRVIRASRRPVLRPWQVLVSERVRCLRVGRPRRRTTAAPSRWTMTLRLRHTCGVIRVHAAGPAARSLTSSLRGR